MIIQGNNLYYQPSFSLSNRIKRQFWGIVQAILFQPSHRLFHRWRALLLRMFGAKLGKDCHVYPKAKIWAPWNLRLGNCVVIGDDVNLYNMDLIDVGDNAVISQGAHLCCGTHDYNSANFQLTAKPIVIGKRAWICAEAFIHPGVEVAEGVVVGARSVVNKSLLLPWRVYTGNPCRQVAERKQNNSE